MIVCIILTFAEVILHTMVVFIKEKEKSGRLGYWKNNDTKTMQIVPRREPISKQVDVACGRVLFPLTILTSAIFYGALAAVKYTEAQTSSEGGTENYCKLMQGEHVR